MSASSPGSSARPVPSVLHRRLRWLIFGCLLACVSTWRATAQEFIHPGLLHTEADFDRMRTKVNLGAEPWLSGWNALTSNGYSQLGASPRPLAEVTRPGNVAQMYIDIYRAYQCALRWKVSGDTRYADQTVVFLNAWSSTMTSLTGNADRFLAAGLHGYEWANVGEIMRTYPGWAAADVTRFQNLLLTIFYPMNHDFLVNHNGAAITNYWANWDLCNMASMLAIGVFCDRRDIYDEALAYIYGGAGNGALDKAVYYLHPGNLGQWQESGRDQGHTTLGIALTGPICEMAWNQGVDLYGYRDNRFLAGAEYVAKYNAWNEVPFTPYMWGTGQSGSWQVQWGVSGASRGINRAGWEMVYNHYVNRLGLAAPYTKAEAEELRPEGGGGNGDQFGLGTLTFTREPIAQGAAPKLTASQRAGDVILSWWGSAYAASYHVKRATSPGGPYVTIATNVPVLNTTYTDANASAAGVTYYYVVTGVLPSAQETGPSNEIRASFPASLDTHLQFDETSGTVAADASGRGHAAALVNGATWSAGKTGNALNFANTSGQHATLPADVVSKLSDFTIASWVYLNTTQTWARIFDFGGKPGAYMFLTPRSGSGTTRFVLGTVHGYNDQIVEGPALPVGQWVHVAVTLSDRVAILYVNGVEAGRNTGFFLQPFQLGETPKNFLGRSQFAADPYLNGRIDDFRIYDYALSGAAVYNLLGNANRGPFFSGEQITRADASEDADYATAAQTLATGAGDPDGNALTFAKLDGPAWLSVAANGALSGSPANGDVGLNTVLVRVTDPSGAGSIARLKIAVVNSNDAPVWSSASLTRPALTRDQPYHAGVSLAPDATDVDAPSGDTLSFSKISGPAWLSVAADGTLSGTPGAADVGANTFVVRVTDLAGAFADATLAITVYPFEQRAGLAFEDTLADTLGNYAATATGSPVFGTGRVGRGLIFDGVDDTLSLPAGVADSQDLTIATWVYWNGGAAWQRIFDFGTGTGQYLMLTPSSGANLRFAIVNNGVSQELNTTLMPVGRWVHVAVTLAGDTGRLYVNGALVATNAAMTLNPSDIRPTQNFIGDSQWAADPLFNGRIDDFRVYNQALSASDIAALVDLVPAVPLTLTATPRTGRIDLTWGVSQGAQTYGVKRALVSGGPYTVVASGLVTASYADNAVVNGTPYYYVVSATNAKGESGHSPEAVATPSDLLARIKFDENTGATALDSTGNGWNATFVNAPAWTPAYLGYGVNLPATSGQHLTLPTGIASGLADFTISSWIKINAFATWQRIFDFGSGQTNYMFLTTQYTATAPNAAKLRFAIRVNSATEQSVSGANIALTAGAWTHVAVTRSGTTVSLYVNGALAGSGTIASAPSALGSTTANYLGRSQFADPYLNGALDDFRVYSRALSAAELVSLSTPAPEPTASLVARPENAGARLSWTAANAASSYIVKRAASSGGPYATVATGVTAPTYLDTGLTNGATYLYVVRTVNASGAESTDSAESSVVPSPLHVHLKLDETAGAVAVDSSGRAVDGNAVNAPTWSAGKLDNALALASASSQYVALPSGTLDGLTDITIMTWVKPATIVTNTRVFDFGNGVTPTATAGGYLFLSPSNGGVLRCSLTTSGYNNEQRISGSSPLAAGVWTHVAVTLSGGVGRVYVNGALVGSNTAMTLTPAALGTITNIYLGRSQFAADPYFNGAIDDFRIYSQALAASDIALFASPLAAPQNLRATPGPLSLDLAWNAVANATRYTLKYSAVSGGPYATLSSGSSALAQTHAGLGYGTTTYYVVSAGNLAYDGPASTEIAATPASALLSASEAATPAFVLTPASGDTPATATLATVTSVLGHNYQLQTTTDLVAGSWIDVGEAVEGTGAPLTFSAPYDASEPRRFYRVLITR